MNAFDLLKRMRDAGWRVAVHNDYEYAGKLYTFWLFTHTKLKTYVKGEGVTDYDAIQEAIREMEISTRVRT